jgi:hypothetical protein
MSGFVRFGTTGIVVLYRGSSRTADAQREAVERFAEREGYELVGNPYIEVEAGTPGHRAAILRSRQQHRQAVADIGATDAMARLSFLQQTTP